MSFKYDSINTASTLNSFDIVEDNAELNCLTDVDLGSIVDVSWMNLIDDESNDCNEVTERSYNHKDYVNELSINQSNEDNICVDSPCSSLINADEKVNFTKEVDNNEDYLFLSLLTVRSDSQENDKENANRTGTNKCVEFNKDVTESNIELTDKEKENSTEKNIGETLINEEILGNSCMHVKKKTTGESANKEELMKINEANNIRPTCDTEEIHSNETLKDMEEIMDILELKNDEKRRFGGEIMSKEYIKVNERIKDRIMNNDEYKNEINKEGTKNFEGFINKEEKDISTNAYENAKHVELPLFENEIMKVPASGNIVPRYFMASMYNPCLTVILQLLYSCSRFREKIIEYHKSDSIAIFDSNQQTQDMLYARVFVNDVCKLFWEISSDKNLTRVQRKFDDYINGYASIHDCYRKVLKTIRTVIDASEGAVTKVTDQSTEALRFIKNLFYFTILSKTWCDNCQKIYDEKFKVIDSIPLEIVRNVGIGSVQKSLDNFFDVFEASDQCMINACCNRPHVVSQYQLTDSSDYILLYGTESRDVDSGECAFRLELCQDICVPAVPGPMSYGLQGVITQANGVFVVRCFYDNWWLIDGNEIQKIPSFNGIDNFIVAIFAKQIK